MNDRNRTDLEIHSDLLDSLLAHIAIINAEGIIIQANEAWHSFDDQESQIKRTEQGSNYFEVLQQAVELGNDYALKFILGMKKVLRDAKSSFTLTYPMQSATETFWFKLTIRPYAGGDDLFVMIHEDISTSVEAKHQLKESQNRYQVQFEQSVDGILITDTRGHVIDANPAASNILGRDREELVNCTRKQIIDIEDPNYQRGLASRKKTGTYQLETSMFHKKGYKIPVELSSRAYRTTSGKMRAIVNFRDISRRKGIANTLLQNKHFTESALNSIPGVFLVLDHEGELIRWNDHMTEELGYTSQELREKNAVDFIVEDQRKYVAQKMEECFQSGTLSLETKVHSKEGPIKDYFLFAKRFEQDGNLYLVGTGIDITEQKRTELENRKNQLMLEQLFDNAPVGITICDTENNIERINKSFKDIFGYSEEEAEHQNINKLLAPQNKMDEAEQISSATLNGQSLQTKSTRITKDGQEVSVLIGGVPVEFKDEVIALYGIYVDISQQTTYQQKIEEALREKETLLAELHHRVKNNLALINSMLELQLFDSDNPELNRELTNIKNRILTIASIHEVLYRNGNLSSIPFNNFLQELLTTADIRNKAAAKNITLHTESEKIFLDLNQSIPCGLFLNELLSLIFNHTDVRHQSELHIRFREYGSNIHIIIEGESIINCAEEIKKKQTLHNMLLDTLVMQLEGQFLWPQGDGEYQKFEFIFTKENISSPASSLLKNEE